MKTRILNLVLALVLIFALPVKAQKLTVGIQGELSTSSVKITNIPQQSLNVIEGSGIMGGGIGPYLNLDLSPLFIRPTLLFNYQSGTVMTTNNDGVEMTTNYSATKMEIPLLIGLHIIGPLYIEGGPSYAKILGITNNYNGEVVDVRTTGFGYRVGAGIDIGRVNIDVNYAGVRTSSTTDLSSYHSPNQLVFGLGINLGKREQ